MPRGHTSAPKGKKVLVVRCDGDHYVAKFKEATDKFVMFYDHPKERKKDIRALSIYRREDR